MTGESEMPNGIDMANYADGWLKIQAKGGLEGRIQGRFSSFLEDLRSNGLIRGILIGNRKGERGSYIWMVFKEELGDLSQAADPRFKQANLLTVGLEEDLEPTLPLHVAYLNPSRLEEHRKTCEKLGLDLEYIDL